MPVQRHGSGTVDGDDAGVRHAAEQGLSGPGGPLPHLDAIQSSFGPAHDLSGVRAHVGGAAAHAAARMGADAYATGNEVAFSTTPSLAVAAHEAAHVVQQRQGVQLHGGVGREGDAYERAADEVADAVVAGRSAAPLLGPAGTPGGSGVQRHAVQMHKPTPTSAGARQLIEGAVAGGALPGWTQDLGKLGLTPPPALLKYLDVAVDKGAGEAQSMIRKDVVRAPQPEGLFMSGLQQDMAVQLEDTVDAYMKALFPKVKDAIVSKMSGIKLEFHPQDLYHLHMTHYVGPERKKGAGPDTDQTIDLVMVFHAKEYPVEMLNPRQEGAKVAALETGPWKLDSTITKTHDDYKRRNFIYLVKADRLVAAKNELDESVRQPTAPETFRESSVNEQAQMVDINYFERPGSAPSVSAVPMAPYVPTALALKNAQNRADLEKVIRLLDGAKQCLLIAELKSATSTFTRENVPASQVVSYALTQVKPRVDWVRNKVAEGIKPKTVNLGDPEIHEAIIKGNGNDGAVALLVAKHK
jgi:hypothetical protein